MKRTFVINIAFLLFINLLIKPIYIFGVDRNVQNTLGAEEYGLYFALFDFAYLFQILNDFGIQTFNNRLISQRPQLLNSVFSNILVIKFLFGLIFYFLVIFVAYLAGYSLDLFPLILVLATNHFLISLIFYLRSNISALGKYMIDSVVSALDKVFMILIIGYLLWIAPGKETFSLWDFVIGQMASFLLTALIAFLILLPHLSLSRFRFRKRYIKILLVKSFPYALLVFLMTIYYRIDGFMIERLLPDGQEQAGIYAASFRLLDAGNMIGYMFAILLLPMFSKMLKKKEDIYELLSGSSHLLVAIVLPIGLGTILFREEIMYALYPDADQYWASVLGILMVTFIVVSSAYVFGALLTAGDKIQELNRIVIVAVILNVVLNYFLIKSDKALGAAYASMITQTLIFIGQVVLVFKLFNLKTQGKTIRGLILYLVIFSLLILTMKTYVSIDWFYRYLIIIILGFVLSFLAGFNQVEFIMDISKKRSSSGHN